MTTAIAVGATPPGAGPRASLEGFACHPALAKRNRRVSTTAVMRPLRGTERMKMRFQLQESQGDRASFVPGGDLGTWISPHPVTLGQQSADVWIVRHPVTGLFVPAQYRFRLTFRWIGAGGHVLGQAVRWSESCFQPDTRPDVLVKSISVRSLAGAGSGARYAAVIANDGLSAVRHVAVQFAPGGGQPDQTVAIPRLGAKSQRTEVFAGPACNPTAAPTITVDPQHRINDLDPSNNSMLASCPASGSSAPS